LVNVTVDNRWSLDFGPRHINGNAQAGVDSRQKRCARGVTAIISPMFLVQRPDNAAIVSFLEDQRHQPFSYPDTGATRSVPPNGYNIDHNRIRLGHGPDVFVRAVQALRHWKMFDLGWVTLVPCDAPITEGSCVAILVSHFGFWSLNASRIVYVDADDDPAERFSFAYGTLPGHVEQGEERFSVEYHPEDNSVWYDLFAFSRPQNLLATLGYPLSRRLQRRFARDSLRAMEDAVKK
jgi:uncharacterized protein (UPF0548 family)